MNAIYNNNPTWPDDGKNQADSKTKSNGRILVVDDNPAIHEDFEKILGKQESDDSLQQSENELFGLDTPTSSSSNVNYQIDHAFQGQEAYHCVKDKLQSGEPYDLAIVDMRMPPGWDGLETIEKLWELDTELQVVICTAFSDYSWRAIVERLDMSDSLLILKKPFDNAEVSQIAAALTKKRSLMRQQEQFTDLLKSQVWEQTCSARRAHEETIHLLVSASLHRDTETGSHIQRVGIYSGILARLSGAAPEFVERIKMAAPMHDVGKIGIPDEVLLKPGKFTPDERRIMQQHTQIGFELLDGSESEMLQLAAEIALNHHENWDGSGYPHNKSMMDIPESARIVSIVDVFDALSQDRVYRPAFSPDKVLEMMGEGIGTKFDPTLAAIFLDNLDEFTKISRKLVET